MVRPALWMPPRKKTGKKQTVDDSDSTSEPPETGIAMDSRLDMLEKEMTNLKYSMDAMRLQALENHKAMETLRAENADNQSRLLEILSKNVGGSWRTDSENSGNLIPKMDKTPDGGTKSSTHTMGSGGRGPKKLQGASLDEFRQSVKKVELPMFMGEDPAGWITRAEVYFQVQETTDEVRIHLAQLCLEGGTIHFFNSLINEEEDLSWDQFKQALLDRYGGLGEGNAYDQLTALRQTNDVEQYIQDFEFLTAEIPKIPEQQYFAYFLHGLKEDIRRKVRSLHALGTLSRARLMNVTRAVEAELQGKDNVNPTHGRIASRGGSHATMRSNFTFPNKPSHTSDRGVKHYGSVGDISGHGPNSKNETFDRPKNGPCDRGVKHLSYGDLLERRQKSLCFKCGGVYSPQHICPDKHLKIMLADELDDSEDDPELQKGKEAAADPYDGECSTLSLQCLSQRQGEQPQTMKLEGRIHGIRVCVLVDSGATHNFISRKLVESMGWKKEPTPSMRILMGDGHRADTSGICRNLPMELGRLQCVLDAFSFDLQDIDMVLGIAWLTSLGEMVVDWKLQTMKINVQGTVVLLRGIGEHWTSQTARHGLVGSNSRQVDGLMMRLDIRRPKEEEDRLSYLNDQQREEIDAILDIFAQVFQEKKGLPPIRAKSHCINLFQGQGPVNVRPYRYAHYQKDAIERQVKDLLDNGVIRHSNSAFSSPVILVRKKDQSWRMCVDYRALNKATIPDKFPIPVIEELLDELHGAKFFTKLDLKSGYHQVRMREEDIHKTAFRTHEGNYEYLVMPFGLMNAPSTFQALMNEVFRGKLRRYVLVFFDDILVYSPNWIDHLKHLQEVLSVLEQHTFFANQKKCWFAQRCVEYLGYIVYGEGVAVDPAKV